MSHPILKATGISKSFGIVRALNKVSIDVQPGEILGLIGENGSGKSTLSSIFAAIQPADEGTITFDGEPYEPISGTHANRIGICMLLQEKGTFDKLTVAKNIMVGREDRFAHFGFIDNKAMEREAQKALDSIHAGHIKAKERLGNLSFEDRKLVELARAMHNNPKLLIVDETTTALSKNGRDILYTIIREMRDGGRSVIFISHDIDELMETCDRLSILRDGIFIDTIEKDRFDARLIRSLMVGREITDNFYRSDLESAKNTQPVLEFRDVTYGALKNVSFALRKGEILGIGGLTDCGMHDVGRIAFGLGKSDDGGVYVKGDLPVKNPATAMKLGVAYISKNRDQEALMTASTIRDNICLPSYPKISRGPLVTPSAERNFVDEWVKKLSIKISGQKQFVMQLSGGNKQKVALAKWLGFGADVFILDCPTRGIDVGVKATIYQLMMDLRSQGKSILLISEELTEIIGMSDRTVILKDGRVTGEFVREDEMSETKLIEYIV